jgi:hypothetical protein
LVAPVLVKEGVRRMSLWVRALVVLVGVLFLANVGLALSTEVDQDVFRPALGAAGRILSFIFGVVQLAITFASAWGAYYLWSGTGAARGPWESLVAANSRIFSIFLAQCAIFWFVRAS